MKNLSQAFEELQKNNFFMYNLTNKQQKNTRLFNRVDDLGRHFDFLDKANFDANLKNFIFDNSLLLSEINYSIFCQIDKDEKKVFFEVIKKRC